MNKSAIRRRLLELAIPAIVVLALLALQGCGTNTSTTRVPPPHPDSYSDLPSPLRNAKVIAVCKYRNKTRTGKLFFTEEQLSDMLAGELKRCGYFRIVDWNRMSDVLARHNIQYADDLFQDSGVRERIRKILVNDFFVTGGITAFSDSFQYKSTAFNKGKRQTTTVGVELHMKDALTNEIMFSVRGVAEVTHEISQTRGFGPTSGTKLSQATEAVRLAMIEAVRKLVAEVHTEER